MKQLIVKPLPWIIALFYLLQVSCTSKKSIPFPENASGFKTPVTKSFEFPKADPIIWQEIGKDSVPKGTTVPLNLNRLPSKPFSLNDFKPLKSPVKQIPLNWDQIEEVPFSLDTVPKESFSIKSFLLPKPIVSKANPPSQFPGTTSGILQMGIEEGLLGISTYATAIDQNGTIWISTERGLICYKGEYFETYSFLPRLQNGNPDIILEIMVDEKNNLWIASANDGVYKLQTSLGILHHLEIKDPYLRMDMDSDGKLWCSGFEHGVSVINLEEQTIQRFSTPPVHENGNFYLGLKIDQHDNIWIGNGNEIYIFNSSQNGYKVLGNKNGLKVTNPFDFYESNDGSIWISSFEPGAYSVSLDSDKISVLGTDQGFNGKIIRITEDLLGKLWLIDDDTLIAYNPTKKLIKKIPTGAKMFWNRDPGSVLVDQDGYIWIGSSQNRMMIIDPLGGLAEHLDMNIGLASNNVWSIVEDNNGLIWMGTYEGINVYDPIKKKLMLITTENGLHHNRQGKLKFISEDLIYAGARSSFSIIDQKNNSLTTYPVEQNITRQFWSGLLLDNGDLWMGSSNGIFIYNLKNKTMKKLVQDQEANTNRVWALQKDDFGNIWAGTQNGIYIIDPLENTIHAFSEEEEFTHDHSSAIHKTENGEIWIGGNMGFLVINIPDKTITNVGREEGLSPATMFDLAELNGRMYIGSENGIIVVEQPDQSNNIGQWSFYNFGKREGYPYNDYNQMASMTTQGGQIWWGVVPQVTVLTQEPKINLTAPKVRISEIRVMDQEPSFYGFNSIGNSLNGIDTLWDESRNEYYLAHKLPEESNYFVENNITWDSVSSIFHMPFGLKLPHDQNSLNFSFTNPAIKGKDKIVYRYVLEGEDQAWSRITDEPVSKNYYNLRHGKYIFKVATKGFNGVWSDIERFDFTILPPWWLTWWAYTLYGLCFIAGVFGVDKVQSKRLVRKQQALAEKKELEQAREIEKAYNQLKNTQTQLLHSEKMASLGELTAGIAHEIQNPLNFVNNFAEVSIDLIEEMQEEMNLGNPDVAREISEDVKQNLDKVHHHGQRASSIVRGMLQHSRTGEQIKAPTDINVLAEEYLRLAYHGLRAKDKSFNADFKADLDDRLPKVNVISQDIGRVLLNLINNAFYAVSKKYSREMNGYKPNVLISTKRSDKFITLTIKDNGDGIPKDVKDKIFQPFFTTKPTGEGTGLGLSLSYDIITKGHGGQLLVDSEEGQGTEFTIILPNI